MNGKIFWLALAMFVSSSSFAFKDSLWIMGTEGCAGDLVTVEVWLQYEGGGPGDSISAFDIPLSWDASICTVEAITIGPDFRNIAGYCDWTDASIIDNQGTHGPPAIPKITISAFTFRIACGIPVPRGDHLAATVDFRVLETVVPPDSTCLDTLMRAFTPEVYLVFVDETGNTAYYPSFSTGCVQAVQYYCGDCNADGRITSADIVYMGNYIYGHGPDPYGQADVNLDGRITVADAIYIGNYIYRRGGEPCNP
jgi:hypothetical protein